MCHEILKKIEKSIQSTNKFEQKNILADLNHIFHLIESQEYKNTSFITRDVLNTKKRSFEFFNYLLGYYEQAKVWCEILRRIPLKEIKYAIDLCPGYGPKIQWALHLLGYEGHLVSMDKNHGYLEQQKLILEILRIDYAHTYLNEDLFEVNIKPVNLIAGNHILDDLLLDYFSARGSNGLEAIYDSQTVFLTLTQRIMNDSGVHCLITKLIDKVDFLLKEKGYLVFSHYFGTTEKALGLSDWSNFICKQFEILQSEFLKNNYISIQKISQEALKNGDFTYFILKKNANA